MCFTSWFPFYISCVIVTKNKSAFAYSCTQSKKKSLQIWGNQTGEYFISIVVCDKALSM